jgi:creatinine amidohydrolase
MSELKSLLLTDLTPSEIRAHLDTDRRLIVPVGACDQYGPHLPIGASTLIVEAFARDLSRDFGVLRSPTIPFGVNVPTERHFFGRMGLRQKTLHALLNDVLGCIDDDGFEEIILLTVHDYDSHVEAMATVTGSSARIRAIELLNISLSAFLDGVPGPEHGGEILTSLMLHLYPERVRMGSAVDYIPGDQAVSTLRRTPSIPAPSPGVLGSPSLATAEKGRLLYEYIHEKIRTRVFVDPTESPATARNPAAPARVPT